MRVGIPPIPLDVPIWVRDANQNVTALQAGNILSGTQDIEFKREEDYSFPDYAVRITANQIVCGKSCAVARVKCIVGVAATITLRDSATTTAGATIVTLTMNTNDDVILPASSVAINGVFGVPSAGSTFDIWISDAI